MKLEASNVVIERSGNLEERSFSMDLADAPHIFNILRNSMYSNKIAAVVREYATNAYDAHVQAGVVDKPFSITLPTRYSSEFRVRDYGLGLSEEDVYSIYIKYGKSTKRDSNEVVGMLGLGAKAAFAYCDSYSITSWHGGIKTSYCAYIDETGVGKIARMFSEPSREPAGVEILVQVHAKDCGTFIEEAKKNLRYFDVKPTIEGQPHFFDFAETEVAFAGKNFQLVRPGIGKTVAVMGQVGYEINLQSIPNFNWKAQVPYSHNLIVRFDIGDLSVSSSRESLQYTDKTCDKIKEKLKEVEDAFAEETRKALAEAESLYDARAIYSKIRSSSPFNSMMPTKWNGVDLLERVKVPSGVLYNLDRYNRKFNPRSLEYFIHTECPIYVIDIDTKVRQRYAAIIPAHPSITLLDKSSTHFDKFIKEQGILPKHYTLLSSVTPVALAHSPKSAKHSLKCFTLIANPSTYRSKMSDNWDAVEIEESTEEQVYVTIDRFEPTEMGMASLINAMEVGKSCGVVMPKVFGFKPKVTVPDNFIKFQDWFVREVEKTLSTKQSLQDIVDVAHNSHGLYRFRDWLVKCMRTSSNPVAKKFVEKHDWVVKQTEKAPPGDVGKLLQIYQIFGGKTVSNSFDLGDMFKEVVEQFPMLTFVTEKSYPYNGEEKIVAAYLA